MYISQDFVMKLATTNLTATTYKVALYLPKLLRHGQVDFSNLQKVAKFVNVSRTSVRRAIKKLETEFVIIPSEEQPSVYYCNPYLIWDGNIAQSDYERAYKYWNQISGPRILAALEQSKSNKSNNKSNNKSKE